MTALLLLLGCGGTSQESFLFEERTFVDPTRPLPELGAQEAADEREILLYAWSDAGEDVQDRPLVVIGHGIDGHPRKFDTFATELAQQGYFVVALAFPSSNDDSDAGVAGLADLENQPGDVAATIDFLTEAVSDGADDFHHRFDPDVFGVIGHSLGAGTMAGWTRFGCCEPRPPEAVVLLAVPQTGVALIFGEPDPTGPPTVLVHGTDDGTLPWQESETFAEQIDETALVLLTGVGHSEAIEGGGPEPARDHFRTVVLGHFDEQLRGQSGALSAALADPMFDDDEIR
jgi:pimeloyl-ACP methyl ester carboxylesterase